MKKVFLLSILFSCAMAGHAQNTEIQVKYPQTKKVPQTDVYFGTEVADPYRWLEDDRSEETAQWVKEENAVTSDYLSKIPYRNDMMDALTAMWNYPKEGHPTQKGNKYFFSSNSGLQNQAVFYVKDKLDGEARVLIDPNTLSKDGTVAIGDIETSNDGNHIAYTLSTGGSDWQEIHVKKIDGTELPDVLKWVKSSNIAWYKDGFFYSRYDEPTGSKLSQKNEYQKVFYHKLGTTQEQDILIHEDKNPEHSTWMYYVGTTEDEKYLFVSIAKSTSNNMLLYRSLENGIKGDFTTLVDNFNSSYGLIGNEGDDLFFVTNNEAPTYKIVKFNTQKASEGFKDFIPAAADVIKGATIAGGKFVIVYLHNAYSKISLFSKKGTYENDIKLPEIGYVAGLSGEKNSNYIFFKFTSFTCPGDNYKYDLKTKKLTLIKKTELSVKLSKYITEQVFYTSKDGTKVPMFIVYKEGLKKDGKNPLLLYGYGGFNSSMTPGFSISRMLFLENGGILVTANLRGGGEFGRKWHEDGTKLKKQNVFDDFIAAAEYLIKEKYTSSEKLAIQGGSNGGLLVGACMTQRPDLFKVALPAVGVLDMLRFHKFTVGWAWKDDYGSSENETDFKYLLGYSPLHNVKEGVCYPATLVTTADHDDRVVPAHSFKFTAELQSKQKCGNPVLIRVETMAGHGAGKPTSKSIEEAADLWAFTFYNLNMEYKNPVKKQ